MATEVDICNLALSRAQVTDFIHALEEDRPSANVARVLYPQHRDALLALAPWPFTTRRATLAALVGEERAGWAYVFGLPVDCLVARDLNPRAPFRLEDDGTGIRVLLANVKTPELIYTASVTNPDMFHPLFRDALIWNLAADFALALGKDGKLEQLCRARYEAALSRARVLVLAEKRDLPQAESPYILVRGGD